MSAKLFFVICSFALVTSHIPCNDFISYYGNYAIVTLKVPAISNHNVKVIVKYTRDLSGNSGDLNLDTTTEQTISNIKSSVPIKYRVRFSLSYPTAQIISLEHNGNKVCEETLGSYNALVTFNHDFNTGIKLSGSYSTPFDYKPQRYQTTKAYRRIQHNSYNRPQHFYTQKFYKTTKRTTTFRPLPNQNFIVRIKDNNVQPIHNQHYQKSYPATKKIATTFNLITTTTPQPKSLSFECGKRFSIGITSFVTGGSRSKPDDFPWLVAHFYSKRGFLCGGSLVSHKIVVTAAHCIQDKHQNRLSEYYSTYYLGKYILESTTENSVTSGVDQFYIHNDWNVKDDHYKGDIAIAVLTKSIIFDTSIQPICIWAKTQSYNDLLGREGIVAGWGLTKSGKQSDVPQYIKVPVVESELCAASNPFLSGILSSESFCAGSRTEQAPCKGDSGGGFIVQENDKFYLRGIVSAGIEEGFECSAKYYALFTDVAHYTDWINTFIITFG